MGGLPSCNRVITACTVTTIRKPIVLTSGPFLMEVYSTGSMYMSVAVPLADALSMAGELYWCTGLPVLVVDKPEGSWLEVKSWLRCT